MAKKIEFSVEDRLRALYDLQLIDSRIDKIKSVRGELPLEVEDLEDEVAGLEVRLSKIEEDLNQFTNDIKSKELATEHANTMIKKYNEQQKNVRNNREFDSLSKETEYQELEIQLSEKRIKEFQVKIEQKNEVIATTKEKLDKQQVHLDHKKAELDTILKETEKEEKILLDKSKEFSASIDDHLLSAYTWIRNKVKNGLAVVSIERGAAGGSFFTIAPQIQVGIANRKKITIDEHSGRILIDADVAAEEKEKINSLFV